MKLLVVVLALLLPTALSASPFLVVDPPAVGTPAPTYYLVTGIGQDAVHQAVPLHVDLASLAGSGSKTVRAQACNLWGCSVASDPFTFTPAAPAVPLGLGLGQ